MPKVTALVLPFALFLFALSTGCQAPESAAAGGESPDRAQKAREVEQARLALATTELKQEGAVADAEAELREAKRKLADAEAALGDLARPTALAVVEAKIERDEARNSAEEAKAELAELEAMYQADEFAAMTKELVLQRGRRRLDIAERRLRARDEKLAVLQEIEQVRERRQKEGDVAAAKIAVEKAERALAQARSAAALEVLEARHALAKAEGEAGG